MALGNCAISKRIEIHGSDLPNCLTLMHRSGPIEKSGSSRCGSLGNAPGSPAITGRCRARTPRGAVRVVDLVGSRAASWRILPLTRFHPSASLNEQPSGAHLAQPSGEDP